MSGVTPENRASLLRRMLAEGGDYASSYEFVYGEKPPKEERPKAGPAAGPWDRLQARRRAQRDALIMRAETGATLTRDESESAGLVEGDLGYVPPPTPTVPLAERVSSTARKAAGVIDAVVPDPVLDLARRPPGNMPIFPLVLVILVLILAIVPMNAHGALAGNSRLLLLFKGLTGGAEMPCTEEGLARKEVNQDAAKAQAALAGVAGEIPQIGAALGGLGGQLWSLHPLGVGEGR